MPVIGKDREEEAGEWKHGQSETKTAAVSQLTLHPDLSAVKPDQFLHDVKSKT